MQEPLRGGPIEGTAAEGPPPAAGPQVTENAGAAADATPRRGRRRWIVGGVVAGVVALLCCGGLGVGGFLLLEWAKQSPSVLMGAAADELSEADAVKLKVAFSGTDGRAVNGDFVVTSDGVVSGTMTDPGAGRAEVVAKADDVAVRGDAAFWLRRAPQNVGGLKNRWIRPVNGSAFPVDLPATFGPGAVGELLRSIGKAKGASTGDVRDVRGQRVRAVTAAGWTALVTEAEPHRLVYLGGPLRRGAVAQPAARVDRAGPPAALLRWQDATAQPAHVAAYPVRADRAAADAARAAVAKVLGGAAAPKQSSVRAARPQWDLKINAQDCFTDVCGWTVSVTNKGNGAGSAVLNTLVSPGMSRRAVPVGVVRPGRTATTKRLTFPNQATPGRTVKIHFDAWVYCPDLQGPDPAVVERLNARELDPRDSSMLGELDPEAMRLVYPALDAITRHTPKSDEAANTAAIAAVEQAVIAGLLPDIQTIVSSRRLADPAAFGTMLRLAPVNVDDEPAPTAERIAYRHQLAVAADLLRHNPRARLVIGGRYTDPATRRGFSADVIDVANKVVYEVVSVAGPLDRGIRPGVDVLGGWPPGFRRVLRVYAEPDSVLHAMGREELAAEVRGALCRGKGPAIDQVVIVNSAGIHTWSRDQFDCK